MRRSKERLKPGIGVRIFQVFQDTKRVFSLQKTVHANKVPLVFREPAVISGYRPCGKTWCYYLRSCFQINNETLNVWTHFLGAIAICLLLLSRWDEFTGTDSNIPILFTAFTFCSASNMLLSSLAHTFHSKSTFYHFIYYQADYAGIGAYGLGKSILFLHVSCPADVYRRVHYFSLPLNVCLAWITMLGCSFAKLRYRRPYPVQRKIFAIGSGAVQAVFGGIPITSRFFNCFLDDQCEMSSLRHHTIWIVTMTAALFFFSSHLPEKRFPGKFDYIGQGHHLFHILIAISALLQFEAAYYDVTITDRSYWTRNEVDAVAIAMAIAVYYLGSAVS